MARTFNGTTDKITTGLGAAGGLTGAATVAVIIKSNSDTQATGIFHLGASTSGAARLGIGISSGKQYYRISGTTPSSATIGQLVADGWGLQAWCRAAGAAQTVRQHSYIFGTGVWSHADNATTSGNPSAPITSCTIGAEVTASFWNGDIAAIVVFDRKLTDQEIESLAWSWTVWQALAPKILWVLDQSAVAQLVDDMTGNGAAQSAISGTTVSTSSVPVFNYSDGIWLPTSFVPAGGSTPKSGSDTGAGADAVSLTAQEAGADTSTGADTAAASAALAGSDSAAGSDSTALAATAAGSDTGSGSDATSLQAFPAAADGGTGADGGTLVVSAAGSDTGAGSDTSAASAALVASESGSGTETSALKAVLSASDSGAGSENVTTGTPVSIAESGVGAETLSVTVKGSITDAGSGSESLSMGASLLATETALGADAFTVAVRISVPDFGLGSDTASVSTGRIIGITRTGRIVSSVSGEVGERIGALSGRVARQTTGEVEGRLI